MKRRIVVIGIVLSVIVCILLVTKNAKNNDSVADIIPTPTEIATIPNVEADAVIDTTNFPEENVSSQTTTQTVVTCPASQKSITALARNFYQAHQEKDANASLGSITPPYSQDEQNQLDFWLGTDDQNVSRLYQSPDSNYTVSSYTLGTLQDRGQDFDERGSKRCQLIIQEDRTASVTEPNSTQSVTRYLDFAIDAGGNVLLTAFRATKDGEKYSGFGE